MRLIELLGEMVFSSFSLYSITSSKTTDAGRLRWRSLCNTRFPLAVRLGAHDLRDLARPLLALERHGRTRALQLRVVSLRVARTGLLILMGVAVVRVGAFLVVG